jgi:uncharacterized repeat protein (TIGR02543 family)
MGTRKAKRWPFYTFILLVISLVLPSVFLLGFSSPSSANFTYSSNDGLEVTYQANSVGVLRTHQSGTTAGGIAISGNENLMYSWDVAGATPANWVTITDATTRGGVTDGTNSLRYIPFPSTTYPANANVTLTISVNAVPGAIAKLYGFHGWLPNIASNNSNTLLSAIPSYDINVGLGEQLVEIKSFGNFSNLTSLRGAFSEAPSSFLVTAQLPTTVRSLEESFQYSKYNSASITSWDVSRVTNFAEMFYYADAFNQPIGVWDMSSATDLSGMFSTLSPTKMSFNQNISGWNVSKVTNFSGMFSARGGSDFNQPIGTWNTSSATNMSRMFAGANQFNQSINSWDVSRVTTFNEMFAPGGTTSSATVPYSGPSTIFNQPLNSWNPRLVTNFSRMFVGNAQFNQPLSSWDTSRGSTFDWMFKDASSFNQDLSAWDTRNLTSAVHMFSGSSSVFNNGQSYAASATGTRPLNWNMSQVKDIGSMFQNNTKFNQSVDGWDLRNLDFSVVTPTALNYVFSGATGFNNGDAQGVSGVMNWSLTNVRIGTGRKNIIGIFNNASSFNQDISSWDMWGQKDSQQIITGATRFNQSIAHFRIQGLMAGSGSGITFSGMSQANYETSIISWAHQPQPSAANVSYISLANRLKTFTTCLSNAAYTQLTVTNTNKFWLETGTGLAGTNPGGCVDRTVTWSESSPYTVPRLVAGQTDVYQITPNSTATSLNSGAVKYMVYNRATDSDCTVDESTGVVTYKTLNKSCDIIAYAASADAQALSSQTKSFTSLAPTSYVVTYDYQSASGGNTVTSTTWRTGDAPITLPTPTRTGYEFGGWFTSSSFTTPTGATYTPTAAITLFARFDSVLTFDSQGGSAVSSVAVRAGQSTTPTNPTRLGYSYNGWFSSTAFTTRVVAPSSSFIPTGSASLFAGWTPSTLTVTYQTNSGSSVSSTTTDITRSVSQPANPTRAGYTFAGWFTDIGLASAVPSWPYAHGQSSNFTLYAGWTANTLTVTYVTNGGSSISSTTTDVSRTVSRPADPTRAGYTFDRWFTNIGLTSAVSAWPFTHGQTVNFTLYAGWTPTPFWVNYETNSGTLISRTSIDVSRTVTRPTDPTRAGFTFVGWFTNVGLTSAVPSWPYTHGNTDDFTLYAKWQSRTQNALEWNLSSTSVPYLGSLSLATTGGSGTGSVSYAVSNTSTCTVSGSTLTPGSAGSICVVTATKAGDASFDAISTSAQTITVTKINQSPLSWNLSATSVAYRGSLTLATSGGSGSGTVVFSVGAGSECSISGTTLLPGDVGSVCQITATKVSDTNYNSADTATQSITVTKISQATLSFSNGNTLTFGQTMDLLAVGGSGNGSISYSVTSAGTTGCSISGVRLSVTGAGTCAVSATKAASTNYNISNTATLSITVSKASQTVSFTSTVPSEPVTGDTYTATATASSGLTPVISRSSGNCTVSSNVVTFTGSGNCVIQAVANSSGQYLQSDSVTQTIAVGQKNQTLVFDAAVQSVTQKTFGDAAFIAKATSSEADLIPTYSLGSSTTNSACAVTSNGIVVVLAVGVCEVVVNQAGNSDVAAASAIRKSINIVPDQASAPFITSVSAGHESITAAFIKPTYLGGASITGYQLVAISGSTTVTNSACSVNGSSSTQSCTVSGLNNGTSYQVKVAAITSAGIGLYSELSASRVPATNPAAVSAFTAVPNNTVIDLAWQDPVSLGGGVFDSYRIFIKRSSEGSYPNSYITVNSQSTRSHQITSLINGESYDVKIVTVTQANTQALVSNTAEAKETPRTVPDSPATIEVNELDGSLVITWTTPVSDGGNPITEYKITVNGVDCTPSNALDQHCLIAAPTAPGTHPVVVKAKNDAGFGAPAATNFVRLGSSSTGGGSEYSSYRGNFIEVYHINIKNIPATGGQVVKIRGRNFTGVSTITVGDVKARILSVSDTVIRFVAPQGVKGSAHLKLQGPTQSSEVRDAFVYFNGRAKPAVRWVLGYVQRYTLLSSEAKAKLRKALINNPETVAVTCIGYQSWYYDTPRDYATVIGRANQACSYLKKLNPELQTRSVIARTNLTGTPSRKLSVQFRSVKLSKSSR